MFSIALQLLADAKIDVNFERVRGAYNSACDLIPALNGAEVSASASAFTMTADGYPLVGPTSHKQNYWLMVGLAISVMLLHLFSNDNFTVLMFKFIKMVIIFQAGFSDGISSSGGMGKYLADWIIDEEPPSELFDTDANRWGHLDKISD